MPATQHSLTNMRFLKRALVASLLVILFGSALVPCFLAKADYVPATAGMTNLGGLFGYHFDKDDEAYSIVQAGNGSVALAGYTCSYGSGGADMWLTKTRQSSFPVGPTIMDWVDWYKFYGGPLDDVAKCIVATPDGGFALAGYTYSYGAGGADMYLVKVDSVGNLLWNATYGTSQDEVANSIVQTPDGGYFLAGYTNSTISSNTWVVKTDASGNMQWNATCRGQAAKCLIQTRDGGYTIAIQNVNAFGLVKLDSAGTLQWNQTYPGRYAEASAESVIQTNDGGYALVGCIKTNATGPDSPWLIKTDSSGAMQWDKEYGGILGAYSIVQANNGYYALSGDRAFLMITDSSGNIIWNKNYDGLSEDNLHFTRAYDIIQAGPSEFAMAGSQQSYGQILRGLDGHMWHVTLKAVNDTTPPAITVLSPENKLYTSRNVPLNFTINRPTAWIGYAVDKGLNITITGNTTISNLSDGYHSLVVYASDLNYIAGASSTVCFQNFVVDATPINLTLSMTPNSTYQDSVPLNYTADKPLSWAAYSLDNKENQTLTPGASLTGLTAGTHSLIAYAQDNLGLIEASTPIQFTVTPSPTTSSDSQNASPQPTYAATPTPTPNQTPTARSLPATQQPTADFIILLLVAAAIAIAIAATIAVLKRTK